MLDHAPTVPQGFAERLGGKTLIVGGVDLTSLTAAETAMASIKTKFGRLDALLNIAGGFQWDTIADGKLDSWDRMYAMNLKTALNACKAALPYLLESGAGRIVNVGAGSALHAASGMGPYAASKSAVHRLTESLADELKLKGVTVNAVLPSTIDTAAEPARHAEGGLQPLGRAGRPRRGHPVSGLGRSEGGHGRAHSRFGPRLASRFSRASPSCYRRGAVDGRFKEDGMSKTALITGATSGIGEAAARAFAAAGWRVIATGRRAERLKALVAAVGADKVHPAAFDVCDETARDAALAQLPNGFRGIDLLINNAGLALGRNPAQTADLAQWKTMIDTNVTALASLTHKLLPGLIARRGAIINVSSVAASYPYAGGNVYGGSKAFVKEFSLGLRSDLHGTGVRVTSIEPGMVETEFTLVRSGGDQAASDALYRGVKPMTGEDIAATMLWVAELPPHLNINRLELMPVSQSFAGFQVARAN